MRLLHAASKFTRKSNDLKQIYTMFVRSRLETAVAVWHSGLTMEQTASIERVHISKAINESYIQETIFKLSKCTQINETWHIGDKKTEAKFKICKGLPQNWQVMFNVSTKWNPAQHG